MQKIKFEMRAKEAEELVYQMADSLEGEAKLRLVERLQRQTRKLRWKRLVSKMRRRFAENPLSAREIRALCESVRQERFERARRH